MKYNNGDRIRVINAGYGAHGCEGSIGIVTNTEATKGRVGSIHKSTDFNIKIEDNVWRVSGKGEYALIQQTSPITVNIPTPIPYTHYYEHSPNIINCIVRNSQDKVIDNQTIAYKASKYKVIYNNLTTIVILEDGSKGISKCSPDDKYDKDKGYLIAFKRAKIKQLQKQLKKLVK